MIASTARHSAQNIAFHELGRQAVMADPAWADGDYYAERMLESPTTASPWRAWLRISPIFPKRG